MKYFVKIKEAKHYGHGTHYIQGRTTISAKGCGEIDPVLVEGKDYFITRTECTPDSMYTITRTLDIFNPDAVPAFEKAGYKISYTRDVRPVYSMPYTHIIWEDSDVKCDYCGITFSHNDLEHEYDDDYRLNDMCPHCRTAECCCIEYETITDFDKRTKERKIENES